jgi:hypothetical protein
LKRDSNKHNIVLVELSKEDYLEKAIGDAASFFNASNINRLPCACCNELRAIGSLKIVNPNGDWLLRLTNRLNWRHTTHAVNAYTKNIYCVTPDVLEVIPKLKDLPSAPKGVKTVNINDEEASVQVIVESEYNDVRIKILLINSDLSVSYLSQLFEKRQSR